MLKLTYTEDGLDLERITASVEQVVAQRTIVAIRTGHSIYIKPDGASFLIPANTVNLKAFKQAVRGETARTIDLCQVDDEFYEISLRGTWIASSSEAHAGIFVVHMPDRSELFVEKLWKATQKLVSLM
jgi:hypothetical protein